MIRSTRFLPASLPVLAALAVLAGGLLASFPAVAAPPAGAAGAVLADAAEAPAAPSGDAIYDPKADPKADLAQAIELARSSHRRILLEVGGNWCIWCHRLHDFVDSHEQVRDAWNRGFVTVNVNFSKENENRKFLRHYPRIPGYPHLFVLDSSGKLLHSENTGLLEHGEGYSEEAILEFLKRWSPPAEATAGV